MIMKLLRKTLSSPTGCLSFQKMNLEQINYLYLFILMENCLQIRQKLLK